MVKRQFPGIPQIEKGANPVMVPGLSMLKKAEAEAWPLLVLARK
jgi:hypothetical protein